MLLVSFSILTLETCINAQRRRQERLWKTPKKMNSHRDHGGGGGSPALWFSRWLGPRTSLGSSCEALPRPTIDGANSVRAAAIQVRPPRTCSPRVMQGTPPSASLRLTGTIRERIDSQCFMEEVKKRERKRVNYASDQRPKLSAIPLSYKVKAVTRQSILAHKSLT